MSSRRSIRRSSRGWRRIISSRFECQVSSISSRFAVSSISARFECQRRDSSLIVLMIYFLWK